MVWLLPVPGGPCTRTAPWRSRARAISICSALASLLSSRSWVPPRLPVAPGARARLDPHDAGQGGGQLLLPLQVLEHPVAGLGEAGGPVAHQQPGVAHDDRALVLARLVDVGAEHAGRAQLRDQPAQEHAGLVAGQRVEAARLQLLLQLVELVAREGAARPAAGGRPARPPDRSRPPGTRGCWDRTPGPPAAAARGGRSAPRAWSTAGGRRRAPARSARPRARCRCGGRRAPRTRASPRGRGAPPRPSGSRCGSRRRRPGCGWGRRRNARGPPCCRARGACACSRPRPCRRDVPSPWPPSRPAGRAGRAPW